MISLKSFNEPLHFKLMPHIYSPLKVLSPLDPLGRLAFYYSSFCVYTLHLFCLTLSVTSSSSAFTLPNILLKSFVDFPAFYSFSHRWFIPFLCVSLQSYPLSLGKGRR